MVTKPIKKPIKKPVEKPIEKLTPKPKPYQPVFKTIKLVVDEKVDLNWISVRRKIQGINIFKLYGKEKNKLFKEKYSFDNPLKNVWSKYCVWFNSKFNKQKSTITEEFNHG